VQENAPSPLWTEADFSIQIAPFLVILFFIDICARAFPISRNLGALLMRVPSFAKSEFHIPSEREYSLHLTSSDTQDELLLVLVATPGPILCEPHNFKMYLHGGFQNLFFPFVWRAVENRQLAE